MNLPLASDGGYLVHEDLNFHITHDGICANNVITVMVSRVIIILWCIV